MKPLTDWYFVAHYIAVAGTAPSGTSGHVSGCIKVREPDCVRERIFLVQAMNHKLQDIISQIRALEDELRITIQEQEAKISYRIEGSKVSFDEAVKSAHKRLKTDLFSWLRKSRPQSILSAPIVYGMIIPLVLLDVSITVYQAICFRLYNVSRVKRSDFIVIDRHQLAYLNCVEKLNCIYCGYGAGVINYAREITSRTEQYWCPIKHARKTAGVHSRYDSFLGYGDATHYPVELIDFRENLKEGAVNKPTRNQ